MHAEPQKEHRWLQQLVGNWTSESDCDMGPDQPKGKFKGKESVKKLGDLWVVGEGEGEMPGSGIAYMQITIGYDPAKGKYVGNWVGSMMTNMWVYEGAVDPDGRSLRLNTEGPSCTPGSEGTTAKYQEVITMIDADTRTFTSRVQGADGTWVEMMTATYRRVK
jgi:hypothetical protein